MKKYKSIQSYWSNFDANTSNKSQKTSTSSTPLIDQEIEDINHENEDRENLSNIERAYEVEVVPHDPGLRVPISSYPLKDQDEIRRKFVALGPCQPRSHNFPQKEQHGRLRRFSSKWFDKYDWLEYSVEKDAAFCFICYLFKDKTSKVGGDAFVNKGFSRWQKPEVFVMHIGGNGSAHNQAKEKYELFKNQKTSIMEFWNRQSSEVRKLYKSRLTHSLRCLRFLLRQGLAFRGHDESESSENKGNFRELLAWLAENNDEVEKVVFKNAPGNNQMTSGGIQKELINSCAKETLKLIIEEVKDDFFGILADESSDASGKEQLALCLRYVDQKGRLNERFLGIVHVEDTTAVSLKSAIQSLLMEHSLSMSKIRGQGYDGASNMRGEIHGLKTLIMIDTPSAYYIHCFAHQLQLTLVAVAKDNFDCAWLFEQLGYLLSVIGVSCKRKEMIRVIQAQKVAEALDLGEIESGKGLNQELSLVRPGDTRWGSHYRTILNVISLYPTIMEVLITIGKNASNKEDRAKAQVVLVSFESFDFVFMAHLMLYIFGYTDQLRNALQQKDQDIVNAMTLVSLIKEQLQNLRNDGWEDFLNKVTSFCVKYDIEVPDMDGYYVPHGRSKRCFRKVKNIHRFRVEIFLSVIDLQLQEFNNRFDEVNMELLICMASLNPANSFAAFDKQRILRLAEFYPNEFTTLDRMKLDFQLQAYIRDLRNDVRFQQVMDLGSLSIMLVETNKHKTYTEVYLLLKLVLILPVATASVERVFSAMSFVKSKLRNSMGDQLLNDSLVTFIEKDIFRHVSDESVLRRFQDMKTRRINF
uniref:TTF-type domain-containing protein n=1 Tax=Kalanchoe fedtschenkoi TaxID=63787 RepID=A0A7N0V9K9_KALFE